MTQAATMTEQDLAPCRACGAKCRVERFGGSHIAGVLVLYMCANSPKFGGECPDPHAYLNVNAWNAAPVQDDDALRSKLTDFLNAFKADPFATGADKVDRLLELTAFRLSPLIEALRKALNDIPDGDGHRYCFRTDAELAAICTALANAAPAQPESVTDAMIAAGLNEYEHFINGTAEEHVSRIFAAMQSASRPNQATKGDG